MTIQTISHPSPNFGARTAGAEIDILLLHYTGMASAETALARLCDPEAAVSAHYLVDEAGHVFSLVAEEARAWHAGEAAWAGESDINSHAIGIELTNPGHDLGYRDFPDDQIAALVTLAHGILARHPIPAARVLGHSDVAPLRKQDPGERFPWDRLAEAGIGLTPPPDLTPRTGVPRQDRFAIGLARFGYPIGEGADPAQIEEVITAFRRHFRPDHLKGPLDGIDGARLGWLLDACDND
jgi:N-acetylmuramoyl-L-alanine amidase